MIQAVSLSQGDEYMNQKELGLYIELQPKLNEYRGGWQPFDLCFHKEYGRGIVKMISSNGYKDILIHFPDDIKNDWYFSGEDNGGMIIWLPLPTDPQDPERIARGENPRGLWGMVDWSRRIPCCNNQGLLKLITLRREIWHDEYKTPTLALLLALKEQWRENNGPDY